MLVPGVSEPRRDVRSEVVAICCRRLLLLLLLLSLLLLSNDGALLGFEDGRDGLGHGRLLHLGNPNVARARNAKQRGTRDEQSVDK